MHVNDTRERPFGRRHAFVLDEDYEVFRLEVFFLAMLLR